MNTVVVSRLARASESPSLTTLIHVLALLLSFLAFDVRAATPDPVDIQEIQYLINSVQALQNAHFVRNGTSYDAAAAADHLRLKLKKAGSRVKTADDFIRLCASGSTVSGQPYEIKYADGRTVTSENFLRDKLAELRKMNKSRE